MRVKIVALLAVAAVAIAAYAALKPVVVPEEVDEEPCMGTECGPEGPSAEQTLADRYAPIVYLQDAVTDCSEKAGDFRPVPVEIVLGNAQVSLFQGRDSQPKNAPTAADLYNRGPEYYLDLPGNAARPGCRYVREGAAFATNQPSVAYARIAREDGFDELVLQYWLYYYFNQWNNKHESDWEMIQIVFEAGSAEEALTQEPLRVGFSQHSSGELADWDDDKLEREGQRPVLRVAAGSHSNRFEQKTYLGRGEQGFGCDNAEGTMRVPLEARLVPATISGPDDPFAWLTFKGRWGEIIGAEFDGPTGPNMKKQWDQPLTWEENLRTSSVKLPPRDSLGPSAINAFCDIVDAGSNILLPIYLELPRVVFAGVAVFMLGAVVSLSRTRFIPAHREPLRMRRRFGQIMLTAFSIYTANARLFIGIGLVFLPVALSVSVIHWLLLNVSPVDPIVSLPRADIGPNLVIAFALSELQFGIAYATVLIACTAALRALDADEPAGVRRSYLEAWHRIKTLLPPRLFAYAVVTGLTLTVIGIPFAIRQAVRWTFIEQSILLDAAGARESLSHSAETASKGFWWTAGAVAALTGIGLFLAPFIGIVLILVAQRIPLADINLLTSVMHVALVPFVAIAFSLMYFELRERE